MSNSTICCIIPTFNEPDLLREAVSSLVAENVPELHILVVNAGKPLPKDVADLVEEVAVPSDFFWTASIGRGFEIVKERGYGYVLFCNADTTLLPGSVQHLLAQAANEKTIACSPAYLRNREGQVELLYSGESYYPTLFHFRLLKAWKSPADAPTEPYETPITGGQGVMFKADLLNYATVDPVHFPQAKGDFDFWLSLKAHGVKLIMVPQSGAVNLRGFGEMNKVNRKARMKKLYWRATAQQSNDSWRVMWALRKKHLPLPKAVVSFAVMYPWRILKGFADVFA